VKILFISRAHPPTVGGIENQNEALARHLSKLTTCKKIINKHGKKALPFFIPWAIISGLAQLRNSNQVLLGDGVATIIGWFLKLFSSKPIGCILHGLDITWDNWLYQKLWVAFFYKKIDYFIAVSQSTKEIAITAGVPEEKITVIPNGVEHSGFTPCSKNELEKHLQLSLDNKCVLLSLGRLVERKGVHWFIENVVTELPNNFVYLVAGDGPNRNKIYHQIKELKLENKVYLLGEVSGPIKESLFTHSDLFIQPNIPIKGDPEGFGITQLEAGICGLPSISSDLEGIKDAVQDNENGWLIEPLNSKAFIARVLEKEALLKQNKQTIHERVKKHCLSHFEWPIIAKEYIDTLKRNLHTKTHRVGFSPTSNRQNKAKKILTILKNTLGKPAENLKVLDIGTGNGEISSFIGKTNQVTSVDIYDSRQVTKDFNFSLCNESLPFKSESFDVIISNHVIEHVENQALHIKEIKRVLKNNGVLYLATPNRLWPFEVHYRLFFLHYLPQQLFIKTLKYINKYEEDVDLLSLRKVYALLQKENLISYSGNIIKNPTYYLMNLPIWLEKLLNKLPIKILNGTTFIHPTFVFIYKKGNE
jgi:glycosyltransferase involved in cell wall biosynthesis/predicted SAM-dependent methyltransferase